jgi:hypothetical protein
VEKVDRRIASRRRGQPLKTKYQTRQRARAIRQGCATHSTTEERAHDARREGFMRSQGWSVVRFWNADVFENLDGVLNSILQLPPPPSR